MYKEKIVIWANENSSYFDDLNEIKNQLYEKLNYNVEVYGAKLLENLGELKAYLVVYSPCKINSRVKTFKRK